MATNANKVLDRLAALLDAANTHHLMSCDCINPIEGKAMFALIEAASALIRLARAAIKMSTHFQSYEECYDEGCASGFDHEIRKDADEAIKALGEVRL